MVYSLFLFPFCSAVNTKQSMKDPSFMTLKLLTIYLLPPRAADARMSSFSNVTEQTSQMTTSCMRSCNLRPRPWWSTKTRSAATTLLRRGGGIFKHFRQLVSSVRSNSSFTVSQPIKGARPRTSRAAPDHQEPLVPMLSWLIAIIIYITKERVRFLILIIRPSPKVRKRVRACFQNEAAWAGLLRPQRPIGRLGLRWNSWSMSQEKQQRRCDLLPSRTADPDPIHPHGPPSPSQPDPRCSPNRRLRSAAL